MRPSPAPEPPLPSPNDRDTPAPAFPFPAGDPPGPASILRRVEADPALRSVLAEARRRMEGDAAHDEAHLLRVAAWTLRLLASEPGGEAVEPRTAVAAALLHDVVNVPKGHADRARASERSAEVAREVLAGLGFDADAVEAAADAVRDHSFSRGAVPEEALGRALQDADRLEALGVLGTFRCVATGVALGAGFFDPGDPWAEARELDEARWSLDHFATKLLRLPDTLLTEAGRAEARRRGDVMRGLLAELGREIGRPPPG